MSSMLGEFLKGNGRRIGISLLTGWLLTLSYFGVEVRFDPMGSLPKTLLFAVPFGLAVYLIFSLFDSHFARRFEHSRIAGLFDSSARNIAIISIVIFVCWIPWLLTMMPFSMGPDTVAQLLWGTGTPAWDPSGKFLLPGYAMSDHHPFLDTYLYVAFYNFGEALFGSGAHGMTLLVIVQSVLMAVVFSCAVTWMRRYNVPVFVCMLAVAFIGLCPAIPLWQASIVKDVTGIPFIMLWLMCAMDIVVGSLDRRATPAGKTFRRAALFIAWGILAILVRKSSLVIVVGASGLLLLYLFVIACLRWKRERFASFAPCLKVGAMSAAVLLVSCVLVPAVLFPALRIAPGGPQETLAIPLQQVIGIAKFDPSALSEEDRQIVDRIVPFKEAVGAYTHITVDPVKDKYRRDTATTGDKVDFLLLWLRMVATRPVAALKASAYVTNFFVRGTSIMDSPSVVWWGWPEYDSARLFPDYPEMTPTEGQLFATSVMTDMVQSPMPFVSAFVDCSTYTFWVPVLAFGMCVWRADKKSLLGVVLMCCVLLPCLVSPAFLSRYAMPMAFFTPLIFGLSLAGSHRTGRDGGR